jgi:hypothetical protein
MSYKEERLPCKQLVVEIEADPTRGQEFLASSIPIEQSHAPIMASLITKAKAAKQAKNQRANEACQCHLDMKDALKHTEPLKLNNEAQRANETWMKPKANTSQNATFYLFFLSLFLLCGAHYIPFVGFFIYMFMGYLLFKNMYVIKIKWRPWLSLKGIAIVIY